MKKLVFMVALCAALVSCGNKKADNTANGNDSIDSTAQALAGDTIEIIDITGEWVGEAPSANVPAPALSLKSDKSAKVTAVPTTQAGVKAAASKTAKPSATPVHAAWKQNPASPATNGNPALILFESIPGKNQTDSVAYEIVTATDSTLTIQGAAGIYKFKKH